MQRTKQERIAFTERYVTKQERLYKTRHRHVWDSGYSITSYMRGHWRNHSCFDCGRARCQMCSNPRRVKWNPLDLRVTLQERRYHDSFCDQLEDYFTSDIN